MPFIDSKIAGVVSEEKKEQIKMRFGQAVSLLHKTESYLMVGFSDGYDLFLGGKKLEKGAYVSVRLYGCAAREDYENMTQEITRILDEELGIPAGNVYVTYHGVSDWGMGGHLL